MGKQIILDFETVGNAQRNPNVATPSLAILVFDPTELKPFDELVSDALRLKFNLKQQFNQYKREWDQDTVDWWSKPENANARSMVIDPSHEDIDLCEMGPRIKKYLDEMGYEPNGKDDRIWARGPQFDMVLFENIYKNFGWEVPFPWWNIRDIRTEIDAITSIWNPNHTPNGYDDSFVWPEGVVKHREDHDVALDVMMMQNTHLKLLDFLELISQNS